MKKVFYVFGLSVLAALFIVSCQKDDMNLNDTATSNDDLKKGKANKVDVYHITGNGTYHLININENALPAHLAHGDKLPEVTIKDGDLATGWLDIANNPDKWYMFDETPGVLPPNQINPALATFVTGPPVTAPPTPPEGTGSIQITVTGQERYNLGTTQYANINLADITTFAYSTYNASAGNGGSATRSGYIQFSISFDGTGDWQERLLYVPSENGTVLQDTWQEWDAIEGGIAEWKWSGFAGNGYEWPDGNTDALRTWDDLLTAFPDIKMNTGIHSFLGIRVGGPYTNGYTENIDAFKFGALGFEQTFDFED